ncbi:PDT-domain-containing protein [Mycena floridula]|nr:PDT-domain-containing protein [Mycena floridula]
MKVAFLGPLGTYSHQAAHQRFLDSVEYIQKDTITDTDVFRSLEQVDFGVVPQENSTFGNVKETYDALREGNCFIRGEITISIQHCLIVNEGAKPDSIECILSHEQALGQCRGFMARNFPSVSVRKTNSTAAAVQSITNFPNFAAIGSQLSAELVDGVKVLYSGIQDNSENYTRFFIVAVNTDSDLPLPWPMPAVRALVRLIPPYPINLAPFLAAFLDTTITRIDRRPSPRDIPFHDIYFLELLRNDTESPSESRWSQALQDALRRVIEAGGEANLLGKW